MDHFSYVIDRQHLYLLVGIVLLMAVTVFVLTGETLERYGRILSRAEAPQRFWWNVVSWFLAGLFFIGVYLYQNSN